MMNTTRRGWLAIQSMVAVLMLTAGPSVAFDKDTVSDLVWWVKADSLALGDGDKVVIWADQSVSVKDATQAVESLQPTFVANALNGKPAVRFDGVDDFMSFAQITNMRTVFWVLREQAAGNGLNAHFLMGDSGSFDFHRGDSGRLWDGNTSAHIRSGTSRIEGVAVDGTATSLGTGTYKIVSVNAIGNLRGSQLTKDRTTGSTRTWHGEIAEILAYSRQLTASEENRVGFYLATKYGLPATYQYPFRADGTMILIR